LLFANLNFQRTPIIMLEKDEAFLFPTTLDELDEKLNFAHSLPFSPTLLFAAAQVRTRQQNLLFEAASVQWLITWWRTLNGITKIDNTDGKDSFISLREISDTLPGAIIGFLPEQALLKISRQSLAKFREAFLKQQLTWPDLDVHDRAVLICVDSMPAKTGLPPLLYPDWQTQKVADRDRFSIVTDKLISSVTRETNIRGAITLHRDRLTTIIHELFKNTHDHARTTIERTPLDLSIRGLYSRYYPVSELRESFIVDERKNRTFNQAELFAQHFFPSTKPQNDGVRQKSPSNFLGLLELSIFDSGPGFAATFLKDRFKNASTQEQFDAVLGCFQTGKSSTSDESRGYGLWKVLRDLRAMKGLIRVRTNKVNVYRDFARYEDMWIKKDNDIVAPEERLLDWKRGLTSKIDEGYPDVQGSYLSVLIPLGDGL
jgi:hypothetical protein